MNGKWIGVFLLGVCAFAAGCWMASEDMMGLAMIEFTAGVVLIATGFKMAKTAMAELKRRLAAEKAAGDKGTRRKVTRHILIVSLSLLAFIALAVLSSASNKAAVVNSSLQNFLAEPVGASSLNRFEEYDEDIRELSPLARRFFRYEEEYAQKKAEMDAYVTQTAQEINAGIEGLGSVTPIRSSEHYREMENAVSALELGDSAFDKLVAEQVENYDKVVQYRADLNRARAQCKVSCSACNGRGRFACDSCNGRGKKSVTWYSEGDWGYTSYSNYECTRCNGSGRRSCGSCGGDGYSYNYD